jgi:PAS domain S-box-containing protein
VAHSDPSFITLSELPETWSVKPVQVAPPHAAAGVFVLSYPLAIADRGTTRLDIAAAVAQDTPLLSKAVSGAGLISAAALLALLIVYRRMRVRLRPLMLIRDALLAHSAGERSTELLAVPASAGADAEAWNELLAEKADLEDRLMGRKVTEALQDRRRGTRDLDSACDVMQQGIVLLDRDGQITYANGAAAVCMRVPREQLCGKAFKQIVKDAGVLAAIDQVVAGSTRTWSTVEMAQEGEGSRFVLRFSLRPLRQDDASAAIVIIEDVTQQRMADESRNDFVTQVTHELRTPLTNIRLYAESAITDGEGNADLRKRCLNVINQESKRLERVVDDMLSVAEIEAGQYEIRRNDVRLEELLESLKRDYAAYAGDKRIGLAFDLPPKLPMIHGDREKISLALHNLLGNAIKYTPEQGSVSVTVEIGEGLVVVEISDTGIGISPEDQDQIFSRFYRAQAQRVSEVAGSGLGLALAREVVRMHGGDITVESELDKGSKFTMTLPVSNLALAA